MVKPQSIYQGIPGEIREEIFEESPDIVPQPLLETKPRLPVHDAIRIVMEQVGLSAMKDHSLNRGRG